MGGGGQGGDREGAGGQAGTAAGGPGTGVGQDCTLQKAPVRVRLDDLLMLYCYWKHF